MHSTNPIPKHLLLVCAPIISMILMADSSTPRDFRPLTKIEYLDFQPNVWALKDGVLTRLPNSKQKSVFALVKPSAVKVPSWYQVSCLLEHNTAHSDKFQDAGIIFCFVDTKNYWTLRPVILNGNPFLNLTQTKGGVSKLIKQVPFEHFENPESIRIGVEVFENGFIKIIGNRYHLIQLQLDNQVSHGQFGVFSGTSAIKFSELELSGVAKH